MTFHSFFFTIITVFLFILIFFNLAKTYISECDTLWLNQFVRVALDCNFTQDKCHCFLRKLCPEQN